MDERAEDCQAKESAANAFRRAAVDQQDENKRPECRPDTRLRLFAGQIHAKPVDRCDKSLARLWQLASQRSKQRPPVVGRAVAAHFHAISHVQCASPEPPEQSRQLRWHRCDRLHSLRERQFSPFRRCGAVRANTQRESNAVADGRRDWLANLWESNVAN